MNIKEKTGNFLLDIAKLIFAGIIIGGIMTEEINRWVLYLLGLFAFVLIIVIGFVLCSQVKKEDWTMAFIISFCAMSIAAILIPLYFVHRDNKRNAAASKKGQSSKEGWMIYFILKTIYGGSVVKGQHLFFQQMSCFYCYIDIKTNNHGIQNCILWS